MSSTESAAVATSDTSQNSNSNSDDGDDWDFLIGCYFCFITLSTIGFGDYVPGTSHVTWNESAQSKLVLCALYLLIGLALQAMCFQLIQEEVRRAVRALGVRLGLVGPEDETETGLEEQHGRGGGRSPAGGMAGNGAR